VVAKPPTSGAEAAFGFLYLAQTPEPHTYISTAIFHSLGRDGGGIYTCRDAESLVSDADVVAAYSVGAPRNYQFKYDYPSLQASENDPVALGTAQPM